MKLFGRGKGRSTPQPFFPLVSPAAVEPAQPAAPSMVLGDPKDKYGVTGQQESEMPSPAHNGVEAQTSTETTERPDSATTVEQSDEGGETDGDRSSPEAAADGSKKKKKKKKKKKGKKKKRAKSGEYGTFETREEDGGIVVDRVPTAMEYESDDSIEKMIDEKSRYSRYTTEYDELDLGPFDADDDSVDPNDKYAAGNNQIGPIPSVMSDESNPPVWSSWDADEEKRQTQRKKVGESQRSKSTAEVEDIHRMPSTASSRKGRGSAGGVPITTIPSNTETSRKSRGSKKSKYQDLREFRKSHSTDERNKAPLASADKNLEEEVYAPYTLPDFNTPAGGGSVQSAACAKEEQQVIKKSDSQQSNNSRKKQLAEEAAKGEQQVPTSNSEEWIAYNTLSGTFDKTIEKSKGSTKASIPPITSDTSSLTDPSKKYEKYAKIMAAREAQTTEPSLPLEIPIAKPPAKGTEDEGIPYGIKGSHSSSTTSSARLRASHAKKGDKYVEIEERHSTSTEGRTNRSGKTPEPKKKSAKKEAREPRIAKTQKELMYTKSLVTEHEASEDSVVDSVPMSRGERTKRSQMKELDEYSVAVSLTDDPALVQCLKFYHCAAAASLATLTFSATSCLPSNKAITPKEIRMLTQRPELDEVDKMRYRDQDLEDHVGAVSPKVEVVLEDDEEDSSGDEGTVDAPDLKAVVPNTSSYLREVTGLSLRLDNDMEEKQKHPVLDRGRAMAAEAETDLSIREIAIPLSSSMKIRKEHRRISSPGQRADEAPVPSMSSSNESKRERDILGAKNDQREAEDPAIVKQEVHEERENAEKRNNTEASETQKTNQAKENQEYTPEVEIIDKKSSEESSRPSKKGFAKIFSRFGRKRSMSSSTSAKTPAE